MTLVIKIILLSIFSVGLNVPLGMWRIRTKKFSFQWFTAIHLAVPIIYLIRHKASVPSWSAPIFITAAVLGQLLGGMLHTKRVEMMVRSLPVDGCS